MFTPTPYFFNSFAKKSFSLFCSLTNLFISLEKRMQSLFTRSELHDRIWCTKEVTVKLMTKATLVTSSFFIHYSFHSKDRLDCSRYQGMCGCCEIHALLLLRHWLRLSFLFCFSSFHLFFTPFLLYRLFESACFSHFEPLGLPEEHAFHHSLFVETYTWLCKCPWITVTWPESENIPEHEPSQTCMFAVMIAFLRNINICVVCLCLSWESLKSSSSWSFVSWTLLTNCQTLCYVGRTHIVVHAWHWGRHRFGQRRYVRQSVYREP